MTAQLPHTQKQRADDGRYAYPLFKTHICRFQIKIGNFRPIAHIYLSQSFLLSPSDFLLVCISINNDEASFLFYVKSDRALLHGM